MQEMSFVVLCLCLLCILQFHKNERAASHHHRAFFTSTSSSSSPSTSSSSIGTKHTVNGIFEFFSSTHCGIHGRPISMDSSRLPYFQWTIGCNRRDEWFCESSFISGQSPPISAILWNIIKGNVYCLFCRFAESHLASPSHRYDFPTEIIWPFVGFGVHFGVAAIIFLYHFVGGCCSFGMETCCLETFLKWKTFRRLQSLRGIEFDAWFSFRLVWLVVEGVWADSTYTGEQFRANRLANDTLHPTQSPVWSPEMLSGYSMPFMWCVFNFRFVCAKRSRTLIHVRLITHQTFTGHYGIRVWAIKHQHTSPITLKLWF